MAASRNRSRKTKNLLARVRMSEREREDAEIYLMQGELIADFVLGAVSAVRAAVGGIARGFRILRRARSMN